MKYLVYFNSIPVPVIRSETKSKFDNNTITFEDLKEELKYVAENLHYVLTLEGVLETLMMLYGSEWNLDEYASNLMNILNMLKRGESGATEVMVSIRGKTFNVRELFNRKLTDVLEPEVKNTKYGLLYVYRMNIVVAGRVGLE